MKYIKFACIVLLVALVCVAYVLCVTALLEYCCSIIVGLLFIPVSAVLIMTAVYGIGEYAEDNGIIR
jgi:multisubunit Na+/H+ antiporter MnhG subunit